MKNLQPARDFSIERVADFRNVQLGDLCPPCQGDLQFHRGIEVGHVFKLGKDADLIGIPAQITVGKQAVDGLVEYTCDTELI